MKSLMECGHTANAVDSNTGKDVCVICIGIYPGADKIAKNQPWLEGRIAKCAYDHENNPHEDSRVPSSLGLAFFEYRGLGSRDSEDLCGHEGCGYGKVAHVGPYLGSWLKNADGSPNGRAISDHEFTPHGPWEEDRYYCGCRGWD